MSTPLDLPDPKPIVFHAPASKIGAGMPSACTTHGCGGEAPRMPPPPVFGEVRVNGVELDPEAIAREIQHHPAESAESAWAEAARALVIRELLLQEARRLGLGPEAEPDETGRLESDEDALVAALLEREVDPGSASESECLRYYAARRDRFRTPDLFEASHILLEPETRAADAWEAAFSQALGIIETVGDDPAAFAEAARELSACPSAGQDGSLGQLRRGELVPEVQLAIEALEPGTTGREPVRSSHGWHVLRLARRIEGQILPFEVVREKIAEMLGARGWSVAATRYVMELADRARVEGVSIEVAADAGEFR